MKAATTENLLNPFHLPLLVTAESEAEISCAVLHGSDNLNVLQYLANEKSNDVILKQQNPSLAFCKNLFREEFALVMHRGKKNYFPLHLL
jgi:hypothetical protein